jgi:predicted transcriptional regulator
MARNPGRPNVLYSEKIPNWARALARRGLSSTQIAAEIGIARATLYMWIKDYPAFADAIAEGKSEADAIVENALYKRATGYDYEETKVVAVKNKPDSQESKPIRIEKIKKHVPADIGAIKMWLSNRMVSQWKLNPERNDDALSNLDPLINLLTQARDRQTGGDDA